MTATSQRARHAQAIDKTMERASASLAAGRYFECERLASDALRQAHLDHDYERMARILLPLQEARRQKRLAALDAADIYVLNEPLEEEEEVVLAPGCWLIEPPLVGADGRDLRDQADEEEIPALVIVREPSVRAEIRRGTWPLVMLSPVVVRAYVAPPSELTTEWFVEAAEALGDAAIAQVDPELPATTRVDRLIERLETIRDHEKLHQALEAACRDALREQPAD